jgi:hypothetical protein
VGAPLWGFAPLFFDFEDFLDFGGGVGDFLGAGFEVGAGEEFGDDGHGFEGGGFALSKGVSGVVRGVRVVALHATEVAFGDAEAAEDGPAALWRDGAGDLEAVERFDGDGEVCAVAEVCEQGFRTEDDAAVGGASASGGLAEPGVVVGVVVDAEG